MIRKPTNGLKKIPGTHATRRIGQKLGLISSNAQDDEQDLFHIDEPSHSVIRSNDLIISGWYLAAYPSAVEGIRAKLNNKIIPLELNTQRPDVAENFPDVEGAINSGFYKRMPYEDSGLLTIEINKGGGFQPFYTTNLEQDDEMLVDMIHNPELPNRYADHLNLLEARKQYFYEPESTSNFTLDKKDPRLIAFYLPQFHPISENDKAWGKGFTEWHNVTTAAPRFVGHQQPFLPQDLGFYDLRLDTVLEQQIAMAKKYGIYGFSFYYYWFSGKKLLEQPLDSFLQHKEWDFNFSICWANENWTKRWDGRDDQIIVAQKYHEDDPINFIKDIEHILIDPRYIRENGKPVLMVYRIMNLKDPARYAKVWRKYMRKKHDLELYLIAVLSTDLEDPRDYGFDIALDFVPSTTHVKEKGLGADWHLRNQLLDINYKGEAGDYRRMVLSKDIYPYFKFPTIKCIMPSWDNEARKKGGGFTEGLTSPDLYAHWLSRILESEANSRPDPLIFINAWNEWAEGTVLEPSMHLGHAVLNRTAEVLAKHSQNKANTTSWPLYGLRRRKDDTKLAVVVHIFSKEGWPVILSKLAILQKNQHDLFVTLPLKLQYLEKEIHELYPTAQVLAVPNRGRDVLPFMSLARRLAEIGYEQVLKLHTDSPASAEKSKGHTKREPIDNLLPNKKAVKSIAQALSTGSCMMYVKDKHAVDHQKNTSVSHGNLAKILQMVYGDDSRVEELTDAFNKNPVSTSMFWATMDTLRPLLDLHLLPDDFEPEKGQANGTMAHIIEQLFVFIATQEGAMVKEITKRDITRALRSVDGNLHKIKKQPKKNTKKSF